MATLPVPGCPVQQNWTKVAAQPPPTWAPSMTHPTRGGIMDDTLTSREAPDWLQETNRFPPAVVPEWDFITRDRKAKKRKAVQDDTTTSVDAPEWFDLELRRPQSQGTAPFAKYRLGHLNRVVLKPLVEEDPHGLEPPHRLPKPGPSAGFIPDDEARAKVEARPFTAAFTQRLGPEGAARAADRFDKTTAQSSWGLPQQDPLTLSRSQARARTAASQMRYGKTSGADYGSAAGPLADTLSHEPGYTGRLRSSEAFAAEPPHALYFTQKARARGFATGSPVSGASSYAAQVATQRNQPVGQALLHAMVQNFGTQPAQHLGATLAAVQSEKAHYAQTTGRMSTVAFPSRTSVNGNGAEEAGAGGGASAHYPRPATSYLSATRSSTLRSTSVGPLPSTRQPVTSAMLRSAPLAWYNAVR